MKQRYNEVAYRPPSIPVSPVSWCWLTATRSAVTATWAASSQCCSAQSPTRRPATAPLLARLPEPRAPPSACSLRSRLLLTTSWASRISVNWPPGCYSAPSSGRGTFRSFQTSRWVCRDDGRLILDGKSAQRIRKHCALAVVSRNKKNRPAADPLPRGAGRPKFNHAAGDGHYLPTEPVRWRSMHAISSYRGNRPTLHTHTETHPTDRTDYNTLRRS